MSDHTIRMKLMGFCIIYDESKQFIKIRSVQTFSDIWNPVIQPEIRKSMMVEIAGADILILSIFVLWIGKNINDRVSVLSRNNIPVPVTGGIIISILSAILSQTVGLEIEFGLRLRDILLLIFFSTIGLGAKFSLLARGGKSLVILLILAAIFLIVQDATGVLLAALGGSHPGYGLFAGSISFAGGHGTAIAWGKEAKDAGLVGADTIGVAFATFGLIAGGLIGGPIAGWIIKKNKLKPSVLKEAETEPALSQDIDESEDVNLSDMLGTILALSICVSLGDLVNRFLFSAGVLLPGFLTAMVIGIALTNLQEIFKWRPLNKKIVDMHADVALNLFLAMSLMSMDLTSLSTAFGPIMLALFIQVLVITVFTVFIVYRLMGRDYDAAVISGGFVGLGLGATPVAIANMHAITSKYAPSPKAFIIIPLVGAFFIDLINALVIKFFLSLPFMQPSVT